MDNLKNAYYLVRGHVLRELAYCREDDILPTLMKSMKNKIPADAEGFYSDLEDPTFHPFEAIFEKGQVLTIEERRLLSDIQGGD